MSQTFLEDIPEFLEIQRNSFLRILDMGLIQAFEKINPIIPTSQCKYGLLFYPKEYVLILPEHTITEAFLQGKTYGCKIYVPAVIYNIESADNSSKMMGRRLKPLRALGIPKTTGSRVLEEIFLGTQETRHRVSTLFFVEMKKTKSFFLKGAIFRTLSWDCFLTMLFSIESLLKKKKTRVEKSQVTSVFSLKTKEKKIDNFISKIRNRVGFSLFPTQAAFSPDDSIWRLEAQNVFLRTGSLVTTPNLSKSKLVDQSLYPSSFNPYLQLSRPILHYLLKKRVEKNSVFALTLNTPQKTRKNLSQISKENLLGTKKPVFYGILPKSIRQKSKFGFLQKIPNWLRGRSNTSLIHEALKKLQVQKSEEFSRISPKKKVFKEWLVPFSTGSLICPKVRKTVSSQELHGNYNHLNINLGAGSAFSRNLVKPLSRKEWVCIGMLPLMTPRGHFIINGSHRIIISQMARAPGLYYQTGEKMQATIVPSKGAWLRLSIKVSDNGEVKIWVRITPQRKMPYKIFIETYKYLENSKSILSKTGSKFLNLTYKALNGKIKHLDKHYAIGLVSSQISRTLLNPSSYSLGALGRKRLNERLGINEKKGHLTSKDITLIKENLIKLIGQKSSNLSADDIDHLENRRVRTCGELLQTEIETGMIRLKKAIGKQLDDYSNPESSLFNTFKNNAIESQKKTDRSNAPTLNTPDSLVITNKFTNKKKSQLIQLQSPISVNPKRENKSDFFWLKSRNSENWQLYITNPEQTLSLFREKKTSLFWKKNQNLLVLRKKFGALSVLPTLTQLDTYHKLFYQPKKTGIALAQACLANDSSSNEKKYLPYPFKKLKGMFTFTSYVFSHANFTAEKNTVSKINTNLEPNLLSPSKIIGTKAFAGALREFFGSNPLSQYMDQTNPLAEITHKRRLSSLGPGGVDRASAGIAIRGIHPSHYGRICPIETPEGKNAGLVNSMTMWARINNEGFLETPYFKVTGGSLMSQTNNLIPHWNYITTKTESKEALKIVSSDLKIAQSAFLPSIALPTRDGSERSFGRDKRNSIDFCGISPMQNISVATSLIPFLEHDDATRALMGSNMQRQAVPLLRAKEPLVRTGLEGKVVGESGHALQASCSGIISRATRTSIAIDSFEIIKNNATSYSSYLAPTGNGTNCDFRSEDQSPHSSFLDVPIKPSLNPPTKTSTHSWQKKQKVFSKINNLPFLNSNRWKNSSGSNSQSFFSPFLSPKPIHPLFYSINDSFKGFFKDWLNSCWYLENFDDLIRRQVQETLDYTQTKEKSNGNTTKIRKNTNFQKPKTINCWRTFLFRLALTRREEDQKSKENIQENRQIPQILEIPQKALMHNTCLTHEKKVKQNFSIENKSHFISHHKLPWSCSFINFRKLPTPWKIPSRAANHSKCSDTVRLLNIGTQRKTQVISKTLWRENLKITRKRKIHTLQQYTRSNQATVSVQRPAVSEGRWVQKGDLIGDCSASKNGVLALGQNIVVAYLPMEGFNFEDAIVVSDRLVHEELYTSLHVQRVEFDMDALVKKHIPRKIKVKKQKSTYKTSNQDWITLNNPHLLESEKENLNALGIINVGSWVGPGDVLVSKVFPVERKIAPSRHLLAAVFQEKKTKILDTDDTSVRVPKGIHGRVINVKVVGTGKTATLPLLQSCKALFPQKKKGQSTLFSLFCKPHNSNQLNISELDGKLLTKYESEHGFNVKKNSLNANNSLENPETDRIFGYFKNNYAETFLQNKGTNTPFSSIEYQVREQRIRKSLNRANGKQSFILEFKPLYSVCDFGPSKKLRTLPFISEQVKQQLQNKAMLCFPNSISPSISLRSQNELHSNFLLEDKKFDIASFPQTLQIDNSASTKNKKKASSKRSIDNTIFFATRRGQEQGAFLRSQVMPIKLVNTYSGITFNTSPTLILKVFFQELENSVTSINEIKRNFNLEHSQFLTNEFNSALPQTNPYSRNLEDLNSKGIEAANLLSKEKTQGKVFQNVIQRENLIEKNGPSTYSQLKKNFLFHKSINTQEYKITGVRIYIAERKKLQVGDKMSGRHGNKGIVSTILPREDMPYLPDGTPIDMVLNPLGIPSRMNVGQVFECLLGLAASVCGESLGHTPFDEMYGPEASRSLVYLFLYVSRLRSHADWIFQPNFPGKTVLFDGRTGSPFEQWVTVGRAYMLKLIHMVDEKIHARSIGPRSLVTQQPVKGRARGGGQRLGEMEIWAFEGFGAAYTLQEILTIKSDDIKGREEVESSIISATPLTAHIPETFRITLFELRCLCLNLELNQNI